MRKLSLQLQLTAKLNAVHYWHPPVCDDEVGPFLPGDDKPGVAIASGHDTIALELQETFPSPHDTAVVIYK
jgi:hypothetical protein